MKYINAMTMLLSLIGTFSLIQLGFDYEAQGQGQGLHPAIAGVGSAFLLALGYYASTLIED